MFTRPGARACPRVFNNRHLPIRLALNAQMPGLNAFHILEARPYLEIQVAALPSEADAAEIAG